MLLKNISIPKCKPAPTTQAVEAESKTILWLLSEGLANTFGNVFLKQLQRPYSPGDSGAGKGEVPDSSLRAAVQGRIGPHMNALMSQRAYMMDS